MPTKQARETSSDRKYRHLFDTESLREDLRGKTIRGGLSSFLGANISLLLRLGSMMLLARLLQPEHFGLIGMVTAITVFAERFKELGLDVATIQKRSITHDEVSALFWINAGIGTSLTAIVCALSPLIAWFYGDRRLILVTILISLGLFLGGITIQHTALMRRQMHFGKIARIQISAIALSSAVGVLMAYEGRGYWSLVTSQVSFYLFSAVGTFVACRWMPSWPTTKIDTRGMLRFGRDVTIFNVLFFLSKGLGQILIGKVWGAGSLGVYNQADKLMMLPVDQTKGPLNDTAVSTLSVLQTEPERYRKNCSKFIEIYNFINIPLAIYLAVMPGPLIHLFLGAKWSAAIPIVRILALATLVSLPHFPCSFVMLTSGKTRQYVLYGIVMAALTILGFSIGVHWGAKGAALGLFVAYAVFLFPGLWLGLRKTPIDVWLVLRSMSMAALGGALLAAALLLYSRLLPEPGMLVSFFGSLIVSVLVYLGYWLVLPSGRARLRDYLVYIRHFLARK